MGNLTSSASIQVLPQPNGCNTLNHTGPIEIRTSESGTTTKYYPLADSDVPYVINFVNDTDENYYFAVYQTYPTSPGLTSIAWQVRRLPQRGSVPTTSKVSWTMSYGISIANWDPNQKEYTGDQQQDAELSNTYEVISQGDFPTINPKPIGKTSAGQILFQNDTQPPNAMSLDMGFTVGGNIIAVQPKVHSNENTLFNVHPSYYVALYRNIKLGQLVDSGVSVGPVEVVFKDGNTSIGVKAYMDAGQYKLQVF